MASIVIDSSAIVSILLAEAEAAEFTQWMEEADEIFLSSMNFVESAIVLESRDPVRGGRRLDAFLQEAKVIVAPIDVSQAMLARLAYQDFGKGRHRASLNLGDCFAYALAKQKGLPILAKGEEFSRTDLRVLPVRAGRGRLGRLESPP